MTFLDTAGKGMDSFTSDSIFVNDQSYTVDTSAKHAAYVLTTAKSRVEPEKPFAIALTAAAVEDWATQMLMRSLLLAAMMGCTPGYFNVEGEIDKIKPEDQLRMARGIVLGIGLESFLEYVEGWQAEGRMQGIELHE